MTFWLIAVPAVVVVGALVWWSSGRAAPDRRRRSIRSELGIREASSGGFGMRDGGGPSPGSGGF